MKWRENAVLLYTYRPSKLQKEFSDDGVKTLLIETGYSSNRVDDCVSELKERMNSCECFPHEIGVFLGYPLEDVRGFIEQEPKNCKCCGFWKVYCNEHEKILEFERLKKCFRVYSQVFESGRNITQMTVSA
jgi:hypothetical protein